MSKAKTPVSPDQRTILPNRRRFSDEFKQDAVRLVVDQQYSFKAASKAVGVSENSLRKWHKKLAPPAKPCGELLHAATPALVARADR